MLLLFLLAEADLFFKNDNKMLVDDFICSPDDFAVKEEKKQKREKKVS